MAEAPKLNFAAAAAQQKEEVPTRVVEVDGQVVLRVVKHCREAQPALVTGQLLGLDIGSTLEITSCFPFPVRMTAVRDELCVSLSNVLGNVCRPSLTAGCSPNFDQSRVADEDDEADGANYQLEMMRCLREVNVDNNTVGWCAARPGPRLERAFRCSKCVTMRLRSLFRPPSIRYQSTYLGSYQTVEFIETFLNYQVRTQAG